MTMRLRLTAVGMIALTIAGCTTFAQVQPYIVKLPQIADVIQNGTRQRCSFVPTVTAIAAILNLPGAGTADAIVRALCNEVLAKAGAERVSLGQPLVVRYEGVRVEGFVAR